MEEPRLSPTNRLNLPGLPLSEAPGTGDTRPPGPCPKLALGCMGVDPIPVFEEPHILRSCRDHEPGTKAWTPTHTVAEIYFTTGSKSKLTPEGVGLGAMTLVTRPQDSTLAPCRD